MKEQHYVGHTTSGFVYFKSKTTPTYATHGNLYMAVIGPFKTKRGAMWAEKYGKDNPHFQHVSDAERLSKKK